ncbi:MAG: hypothetical protein ACE5H1_10380 [Thermodesulfobacteriota bacterium]
MRKTIKISTLICMVMTMVNLTCILGHDQTGKSKVAWEASRHEYNWSGKGSGLSYKPVADVTEYKKVKGELLPRQICARENDNYLYEKWCEETFDNGKYIYAAYKNIAFNIKYKPEAKKTDFW